MEKDKDNNSIFDPKGSLQSVYVFTSIYSMCVIPFWNVGFGTHAFGFQAVLALFFILTVGAASNSGALLGFAGVWLAMLCIQRVITAYRVKWRGEVLHSRYEGDPLLAFFPGITRNAARYVLQPILTVVAGAFLGVLFPPLCTFLLGAGVSLFLKGLIDLETDRARVRQMRDAHIEQVYVSRRYRQGE